jgi:isopenicillin-N epimerase
MASSLKSLFLLDPDIIFLNHGSFGACPQPVFEVYQDWQRRLERQPVLFLGREFPALERQASEALSHYLHTSSDNLVFIPNATYGLNAVARSLTLAPGDEILTTNHEYGACDYTWDFISIKTGAKIKRQVISLELDPNQILEQLWEGVTPLTKVIYLSHISSPTAMLFPVKIICERARDHGILTIIDGAHTPGQIPLDMDAIGADFYFGNLHKWAMAPKGAGYLYTRPDKQSLLEPLVVSWGYRAAPETTTGSQYLDTYQWSGTRDPAAALSVPAAIQFMADYQWDEVRAACHTLLNQAVERINTLVDSKQPDTPCLDDGLQMGIAHLPIDTDLAVLKSRLYDEYRIEVPLILWGESKFIRISVQGYNTQEDIDALVDALTDLL